MTIKIHDLHAAPGSAKARVRVGRGTGGRRGKTAGRGTKGQGARDTVPMNFEGGQMPFHMRVPKLRGFNNPFRVEYQAINLDTLEGLTETDIDPGVLHGHGLTHKGALVKVLGRGELTRKLNVKAHAISRSAERAVVDAGGTVEILPKPWGDRRPPAKGNHLANR